jgi:hypothetical protein
VKSKKTSSGEKNNEKMSVDGLEKILREICKGCFQKAVCGSGEQCCKAKSIIRFLAISFMAAPGAPHSRSEFFGRLKNALVAVKQ